MPENRRTPQDTAEHRRTPQNTAGRYCKDRRTPQDAAEITCTSFFSPLTVYLQFAALLTVMGFLAGIKCYWIKL